MESRSNNIILLNEKSAQYGFLRDVCDQLNQLTIEHIHPTIDALIPHLLNKIEVQLEQTSSNHDIMMKMEMKNALLKHQAEIILLFKEQSSTSRIRPPSEEEKNNNLVLLDNTDLNHKLVWITAAEKMSDKENLQPLFQIRSRFERAFPDFDEQIPATPEKLCESFSIALDIIRPEEIFKQQLLAWFTQYIREPANILWNEANQLLEDIGLELITSTKQTEANTNQQNLNEGTLHKSLSEGVEHSKNIQAMINQSENISLSFMDSLADKLASQVESMLIRDDLIPESKKYQVRAMDLAGVLTGLQLEIMQQHASITNLAESIQSALNKKGENSKLSPRHEDLINLVGMLFEFILDDHQLPESIRKLISLLQIPVLRAAILDHEFLTERNHPARVLLNEMTSAGMDCTDNCFTDPVYLLIDSIVHIIISQSYENPDIFKECLKRFRTEMEIINQPEESVPPIPEETTSNDGSVIETPEETDSEVSGNEETTEQLLKEHGFDDAEEIILESSNAEQQPYNVICNEEDIDQDDNNETMPIISEEEPSIEQHQFTPIRELKIGQWVEFVGEGKSHRLSCKLAQIDQDTNRYIFENQSGMKVVECDGSQLLNDIENGSIIVKPEIQIFERALQAVFEKFKLR